MRLTADELAESILERQGQDVITDSVGWREAHLTAKQTIYLLDLARREGMMMPISHGHREAAGNLWSLQEQRGGSGILKRYLVRA